MPEPNASKPLTRALAVINGLKDREAGVPPVNAGRFTIRKYYEARIALLEGVLYAIHTRAQGLADAAQDADAAPMDEIARIAGAALEISGEDVAEILLREFILPDERRPR